MIDYTLPLDQLPDPLPIEPLRKPFDVTITPPGSKSITCRAYVLAALAEGESKIIRPLRADDPDYLLNALCTLGAEARWVKGEDHDGEDVYIKGVGGRFPRGGNLYMGDGGAPTRFMIAAACLAAEPVTIDASPRMRERPIAEGVEMLRQLGAKIEYVEEEGRLPLRVVPSKAFDGGELNINRTLSSQFISALMLLAPFFHKELSIRFSDTPTSVQYLQLTRAILSSWKLLDIKRAFGPKWQSQYYHENISCRRQIFQPTSVAGRSFEIESDASAAIHWWLAATVCPGSTISIRGLPDDSKQPDARIIGGIGRSTVIWLTHESVQITGAVRRSALRELDAAGMPDGAMALTIYAALANDELWYPSNATRAGLAPADIAGVPFGLTSRITGLRTLRVKETDRIAALANELRKVGCTINTGDDWIEITPPVAQGANFRAEPGANGNAGEPIIIETYNDHRIAMSFAVLGLNPPNGQRLAIRNPACVKKSYPTFWKDFAKLYQ